MLALPVTSSFQGSDSDSAAPPLKLIAAPSCGIFGPSVSPTEPLICRNGGGPASRLAPPPMDCRNSGVLGIGLLMSCTTSPSASTQQPNSGGVDGGPIVIEATRVGPAAPRPTPTEPSK